MFGRWKSHIFHAGLPTSYCGVCCFSHPGPEGNALVCTKILLIQVLLWHFDDNPEISPLETFEASKFDFNWSEVAGVIGLGLLGMELHKQGRQVSTSQREVVPLTSIEGNESPENLARESQSADFSPALGSENFQGGRGEQSLEQLCTVCLDAPKDSFFDPCGHRCTCYACGMRYLPMIQWQQMIPFADVLVVCWWGYKQLGLG